MKSKRILFAWVVMGLMAAVAPLAGLTSAEATSPGLGVASATLIARGDRQLNLDNVPRSVQSAVINDLSRNQNIPERQIRITEATRQTWPNPCLGLQRPEELCSQVQTEGWRMVLTDGSDRWVYRTNETGQIVRIESAPRTSSTDLPTDLPRSVSDAVLQAVSSRARMSANNFRIVKTVRQTWPNGCLGVPQAMSVCTQAQVEGWEVTVISDRTQGQRWIYRTDNSGRTVILSEAYDGRSSLPQSVANAVLQDAANQQGKSLNQFEIIQSQSRVWPDSCLGLSSPNQVCSQGQVPGWQVTVRPRQGSGQPWVYHTNASGDVLRLNQTGTTVAQTPVNSTQIPDNEMPQPLTEGIIFRSISSGGITGQTYETVLMNDGTLMQVLQGPGNANDSGRRVGRISPREVQEFRRLLSQQKFQRYNRLNFPPSGGAADYITVTLSSRSSTTRYADLIQEQLPSNLQTVIQSWNQIVSQIGR